VKRTGSTVHPFNCSAVQPFNRLTGDKTMSDVIEFGFEDAKEIKIQEIERFKQDRPGQKDRVSIIAFRTYHEVVLSAKAKEKGEPLTDEEKAEFISKIDAKLKEQLKKEELTEVDRLDIKSPRFSYAFTHYGDGVGTIRCLGKYQGNTLVKPGLCCNKFGDADQMVATVIIRYPTDEEGQVDAELLAKRKYTKIELYRFSAKKFRRVEGVYVNARSNNLPVIDLNVTLDGDPQYQKQLIESAMTAYWAREDCDPEIRQWILEQGLRAYKYVPRELGFELSHDKLAEKLGMKSVSQGNESGAAAPVLKTSYDDLLE
jgi:hypothetical protein